jgi:hypothetical protein
MREQKGLNATTVKRRASLPPEEREYTASRHHVGTRSGMHPEDRPYTTTTHTRSYHAPTTEHFIALNNHGTIEVLEIPSYPSTTNQPRLYLIVRLTNQGADLVPATLSFPDINGDGKPDMQVSVLDGSSPSVWVLFNNGTSFVPKL